MPEESHQYVLELFADDALVGRMAVEVDWEPAHEWTRLSALRKGDLPLDSPGEIASIQPLWHAKLGEPYISGFRLSLVPNGKGEVAGDFPTAYFRKLGDRAASYFVQRGKLQERQRYAYAVAAYPRRHPAPDTRDDRLTIEEEPPVARFRESRLADCLKGAVPAGIMEADDLPVFLPQQVLDEAAAQTRAADGKETGGILIGHLHWDAGLPEIFVEVTAQIPNEVPGETTRLSFTPETWTASDAAIRLRGRGEVALGYFHSHPIRAWCAEKECSPDKVRTCAKARDFFSADDEAVMRAAFPRAWSLGLVVNDAPFSDLTFSLFGWKRGQIELRGYYVT